METCQASQLVRLALILSFVPIYAVLCKTKVLLTVLLHKTHYVIANLGFLRKHVFCNFLTIESCIMVNRLLGTQLACALQGNLADFFCSMAVPHGQLLSASNHC